ncbi:MAG TPA: aldehyde dehydrogenase family protein, partial [Beutenbergiaceae bacterium]|nr:aldehyde dehydrogenase family protein [Beutenbergiaceae bacterium]
MTATTWKEQVSTLSIDGRGFINGRRVEAASGQTLSVTSPATLETLTEVFHGDSADVDAAVAAAREAFESGPWARMGAAERGEALIRLADLLMENLDELALLESLDSGKPIAETRTVDIPGSAATF